MVLVAAYASRTLHGSMHFASASLPLSLLHRIWPGSRWLASMLGLAALICLSRPNDLLLAHAGLAPFKQVILIWVSHMNFWVTLPDLYLLPAGGWPKALLNLFYQLDYPGLGCLAVVLGNFWQPVDTGPCFPPYQTFQKLSSMTEIIKNKKDKRSFYLL